MNVEVHETFMRFLAEPAELKQFKNSEWRHKTKTFHCNLTRNDTLQTMCTFLSSSKELLINWQSCTRTGATCAALLLCIFNSPSESNWHFFQLYFVMVGKLKSKQRAGNLILACACSDFHALIAHEKDDDLVACVERRSFDDTKQNAF